MPVPRIRLIAVIAVVACAVGFGSVVAHAASPSLPACQETEKTKPAPGGADGLIELQTNAARPTLAVPLGFKTSGNETITFTTKGGVELGQDADIAAELVDSPRAKGSVLGGTTHISAHANESGRRAVVEICVSDVPKLTAGRFEGSISVYGPTIANLDYALVITTKWPREIPIGLIALSMVVFVTVLLLRNTKEWKGRNLVLAALGAMVAIGLASLTYWGSYASNDTWGDDPATQLPALVMASITAAAAGWAAFEGFYSKLGKTQ